jgi:Glycosyltransferase sugar-binding region containing DXD motif
MAIPNRLFFIWFGRSFPYGNLLAMRSARKQCRPDEIYLIADTVDAVREQLGNQPGDVGTWPELRVVEANETWFDGLPAGGEIARQVFAQSKHAPTRANLLRLAALHKLGGVYLDFDTVTVRDLSGLREASAFFGLEHVVLPRAFYQSRNPLKWVTAGLRLAARDVCARLPSGWRFFRALEGAYFAAANNAVLGSEAGHAFLAHCFALIARVPEAERFVRFRLGTHLLQEATLQSAASGVRVVPPAVFYPLGPEVSNHWFRPGTAAQLDHMLLPSTQVVHWYNSVEGRYLKQALDESWLVAHADTAMAEMVRRYG